MSAFRLIAAGAIVLYELSEDDRKLVQKGARDEAHSLGYWISACKYKGCCKQEDPYIFQQYSGHYLVRWNKKMFSARRPGITQRNKRLITGTFADCCRELVNLTTKPLDHNNFEDATHA